MVLHGLVGVCFGADGHVGVDSVLSAHHMAATGQLAGFVEGPPCTVREHSACLDVSIEHGFGGSARAMERADAVGKVITGSQPLIAVDTSRSDADRLMGVGAGWVRQGAAAESVPTSAVVRSTVLRI